ncbi:MAG: peptidoglycan D,D-transpeptidase FtsI family protein [Solirubrobacteraceae bacterium]
MNKPIARLFSLVVVLFALLIGFTSRWTVFEASALRHNPLNQRLLLLGERIARGDILAADGSVLARSARSADGTYERTYPFGPLFAQTVGHSYTDFGQSGMELYREATLAGQGETTFQSILDSLQGKEPEGDNVVSTLNVHAQQVATAALEGYRGSVVALEPATGAVRVRVSSPAYNPAAFSTQRSYDQLIKSAGAPIINRAVQFGYAPGSTFKIVTAAAALDSGQYSPSSLVSGRNGVVVSGVPMHNDNNESFGEITLTEALAKSVDTVWAQVAEHVGKGTMARYMTRFGFDRLPQLDYPSAEMSPSGEYESEGEGAGASLLAPTNPAVDVGRLGIGQDKLKVTPLQMAEVVSAVANHGILMAPRLTERITDPEGRTIQTLRPRRQASVMKPATAEAITGMMEAVVNEGTGTPAQIPGVQVAGKTGTAETQFGSALNDTWFVAFAPARAPKVAIAVTVEKVPGYGATYAAPVAKRVMEALLG